MKLNMLPWDGEEILIFIVANDLTIIKFLVTSNMPILPMNFESSDYYPQGCSGSSLSF